MRLPARSARFQKLVELPQSFLRARGEQPRGKARESSIRIADFTRPGGERLLMADNRGEIAAGDRAGPGFARTEAFEIRECLANQRHESHFRMTAGESATHQNPQGTFDDGEEIGRSESAGSVIGGLGAGAQGNGKTPDGAGDAASGALGAGISLNGENDAIERGGGAPAESLQRMHRARGSTEFCERREFALVESAAGVQDDFAAPFFSADAGKFGCDFVYRSIRRGNENDARLKNAAADSGVRLSGADGANGSARGGLRAGDDGADFPIEFAKAAAESAPEATRADNGNSGGHGA